MTEGNRKLRPVRSGSDHCLSSDCVQSSPSTINRDHNENMPKITFAIPCYNMERWLPVTLESVLQQSEPDVEALVIDDGSTDRSGEIADFYAKADPRIRVIHQPNGGLGKARQTGQDNANGTFITWLDADDFLDRHAARNMLGVAERDNVDMVCGNAVVFSDTTFNTRRYFHLKPVARTTFDNPDYWKCKVVWRWIFNLDFLRRNGFRHAHYKYSQDVCFMYQALSRVGHFSQCPDFFYYFRQEHKSNSVSMEGLVEHQFAHFKDVTAFLSNEGRIKPMVKYLQENYLRDTLKFAARIESTDDHWAKRWLEHSLAAFNGLDPQWFTPQFMAPELKCRKHMPELADALIRGDESAAMALLESYMPKPSAVSKPKALDKAGTLHTIRRRIKSRLSPLSWKARTRLHALEKRAAKRRNAQG